jgi:hypothetical protein
VHSQIADYPEFSDDSIRINKVKNRRVRRSESGSAIESDSSFEAKINPEIIPEFIRMDSSDQEDKDKT